MLRQHRSFLLFILFLVPLAAVFCAVWTLVTGEYRPPFWAVVVAAVVTALVADQLEMALSRRLDRRASKDGAPTEPTEPTKPTEGSA